jgi:hypothetical protein
MGGTLGVVGGTLAGAGAALLPQYTPVNIVTPLVSVTTGDTAHTMGAWTEMIASTAADAGLLVLYASPGANGVDSRTLVDIGVGAAGTEVVKVPALPVGGHTSPYPTVIPLSVPAGSRVAIRTQGGVISRATNWGLHLYDVPDTATSSDGTVDVYGADTATSLGTYVVSSSGWVQMTASTTRAYRALVVVPSVNGMTNPVNNSYLRMGAGSSGAETELARVYYQASNTENLWTSTTYANPLFTSATAGVPAGTRLCVATSSTNSLCAAIIGVPA